MRGAPSVVNWSTARLDWVVRGTDNRKLYQGCYSGGWGCGGVIARRRAVSRAPHDHVGCCMGLDIYKPGVTRVQTKPSAKLPTGQAKLVSFLSLSRLLVLMSRRGQIEQIIGVTAYTKSRWDSIYQIGDQTLKISDCSMPCCNYNSSNSIRISSAMRVSRHATIYKLSKVRGNQKCMPAQLVPRPNGFSKAHSVRFTTSRRQPKQTLTGKTALTRWDAVKDLQLFYDRRLTGLEVSNHL